MKNNKINICEDCGEKYEHYGCENCCNHDFDPDEGYICLNCGKDGAEEVSSRAYDRYKDFIKYGD